MPDTSDWSYIPNPTAVTGNTTITPPAAGSASNPNYYLLTSFVTNGNLTVNPYVSNGTAQETYVAIHVTGDVGSNTGQGATITVPAHVHLQVYFDGNFGAKAENIINTSGYAGNVAVAALACRGRSFQLTDGHELLPAFIPLGVFLIDARLIDGLAQEGFQLERRAVRQGG